MGTTRRAAMIRGLSGHGVTHAFARAALVAVAAIVPQVAGAHGFAGKRFFPATIATDDPFVAGEATPLQVSHASGPDHDSETDFSADVAGLITPRFGISAGESYTILNPSHGSNQYGFGNLELGAKYLLGVSAQHEAIVSLGVDAEVGGTGSHAIGADSQSTVSPGLFFGKGMGDLPDSLRYLKPFAVTGLVAPNFVTGQSGIRSVDYGVAIEYNLRYLQSFVQDVGLRGPLERVIPLVEIPMETCTAGCEGETTTGTVNPGLIYSGHYGQVGLEASIPINRGSGSRVGAVLQFHLYLDDILAHTPGFGRPLFE